MHALEYKAVHKNKSELYSDPLIKFKMFNADNHNNTWCSDSIDTTTNTNYRADFNFLK